jgi:hypothetical protein
MRGFAHLWRLPAKVIAVQFNQVEAEEEHRAVMAPIPDAIEAWHAIVVAGHRLAVDDAGARAEPSQGLDDQREAVG